MENSPHLKGGEGKHLENCKAPANTGSGPCARP
jgi:hypothetical protein